VHEIALGISLQKPSVLFLDRYRFFLKKEKTYIAMSISLYKPSVLFLDRYRI
jgi:hypothetical protein